MLVYKRRAYDRMVAVWRYRPSKLTACQWVCIAVVASVDDALELMRQEKA